MGVGPPCGMPMEAETRKGGENYMSFGRFGNKFHSSLAGISKDYKKIKIFYNFASSFQESLSRFFWSLNISLFF